MEQSKLSRAALNRVPIDVSGLVRNVEDEPQFEAGV